MALLRRSYGQDARWHDRMSETVLLQLVRSKGGPHVRIAATEDGLGISFRGRVRIGRIHTSNTAPSDIGGIGSHETTMLIPRYLRVLVGGSANRDAKEREANLGVSLCELPRETGNAYAILKWRTTVIEQDTQG